MTSTQAGSIALEAAISNGQLNFGGRGGGFSPCGDVGGQQILFYAGSGIDAIQIGDRKYGGGGGSLKATAQIPADGKIYIAELHAVGSVLCYIKMKIGDTDISVGDSGHDDAVILALPNIAARFAGFNFGSRVDKMYFTVVS